MARCQETLAPSAVGILTRLRCYYHRDLQWRPVHGTSRPRFCPATTPTYRWHAPHASLEYRRPALAPSIFGAPELGR